MSNRLRLIFDLTERQHQFLSILPHGAKQQIYAALTDMLIEMTHRCGTGAIGAIIAKRINMEEYFGDNQGPKNSA